MRRIINIFYILFIAAVMPAMLYAQNAVKAIESLRQNMSSVASVQADFIQQKNMQVFSKPLVIKGSIYLQKPGRFSWRTHTPMKYNLVMNGSTIKQWDEESRQVQEFSLDKNPAFSAAFTQMTGWFGGDYAALEKDYDVTVIADKPLALCFVPKAASIAYGLVDKVDVVFREDKRYIAHIDISEKNGDSTRIDFLNTRVDVPIDPKAWEVKSSVRKNF